MAATEELMTIRNLSVPNEVISVEGADPILPTRYPLGDTASSVFAAIGVAVNDLWEMKTGRRQKLSLKAEQAAAALRSYQYLSVGDRSTNEGFAVQRNRQGISTPHPTRDGRWFLPHMGLPHLAERILGLLECDYTLESVRNAVAQWDALELENAIADVNACGAMVRTAEEWSAHPHGVALARRPVIEIEKIAESDPVPLPDGDRPLGGMKVLDLTRILAGPTCARTMAEHGADVLMVTAEHLPQSDYFVMDTSHGKRSTFLDLNREEEHTRLLNLIDEADVFSQGYRPGIMDRFGLSPEELAARRPGIVYTSMNCYGYDGPFRERAGWEQLAQTVTGIAAEHGGDIPRLLPAAACDYLTGYLAAYGTLLALGRRAREGGTWHVRASLCQSGMFLQRQHRVAFDGDREEIDQALIDEVSLTTDTDYGQMTHLGPILRMSETSPGWDLPSPRLGTHDPRWLD